MLNPNFNNPKHPNTNPLFRIVFLFYTATFLSSTTTLHAAPKSPLPNILFIMADDLGYGDLGCYGQQKIQTPHIDSLAKQGTQFLQTYAGSSVCAPSRCCLMTGVHNGHARVRDNIPHGTFLKDEDTTLAEVLKTAGYRTGAVGKWSLGIHGSEGKPNDQGFDDWYGHLDQDQAHFYYPDYLWDNNRIDLLFGNRGEAKKQYTHDLFTDRALKFIQVTEENKEQPFFLYLAYTLPHWSDYPGNTPESQIVPTDAPYTNKDWPQVEKNYAAMVTRMDRDVGRLLKSLEDQGLTDNTIVFFTSDNGPCAGAHRAHKPAFFNSRGGMKGEKRSMYEAGIRVPMVVRWPGHVPAGRKSDQVWAFWDVMPTFAELAGVVPPENIDGISMVPTLLGQPQESVHESLYWDYGHSRGNFKQAVRWQDWKGIKNRPNAEIELYNLKTDLTESNNIADKHPAVVAYMKQFMEKSFVSTPNYPIKQPKK